MFPQVLDERVRMKKVMRVTYVRPIVLEEVNCGADGMAKTQHEDNLCSPTQQNRRNH